MEFSILHKIFDTAIEVLLWIFFWYVAIWNWMDGLMNTFALCADQPYISDIIQAWMFSIMLTLIESLLNIPFSIYHNFVIEEKYGFNKMTPGTFICDEIKKFVIVMVLYAAIIPLLLWIIHVSGPALVLTLAACSIGLIVILSLLVPTVIVPLFFTYSDLEEGELRDAVLNEARKTDVSVAEVKVIDDLVAQFLKEKEDEIKHKQFCVDKFNSKQLQTKRTDRENEYLIAKIEDLEFTMKTVN